MIDNIDMVQLMLDAGADVNATDERGDTPLHAAASYGQCVNF